MVAVVEDLGTEVHILSKEVLIEQEVEQVVVVWVELPIIVVQFVEVNQDKHSLAVVVVDPKEVLLILLLAIMVATVVPVSSSLLILHKYLKNSNEYSECKSNTTSRKRSDSNDKCCECCDKYYHCYYCQYQWGNY